MSDMIDTPRCDTRHAPAPRQDSPPPPPNQRDLTTGALFPTLVTFAAPFFAANLLQALYGAVDLLIVGRFASGVSDVAAVACGSQVMTLVAMFVIGLTTAGTVLIGNFYGAKDHDAVRRTVGTMLSCFFLATVVVTAVMFAAASPILRFLRTPPEAFEAARDYINVCSAGTIFIFGYNAFSAILRGVGNSRSPMIFVGIACLCNLLGDLVLVGWFKTGPIGAAYATVASQGVSMIFAILYIKRQKFLFDFRWKSFIQPTLHFFHSLTRTDRETEKVLGRTTEKLKWNRYILPTLHFFRSIPRLLSENGGVYDRTTEQPKWPYKIDRAIAKKLFIIGLPLSLQSTLIDFSFMLIFSIINTMGVAASAGYGICCRINGFTMLPSISLGMALTAIVAQNLGAGKPERALAFFKLGVTLALGIALFLFCWMEFWPETAFALFTQDAATIAAGALYMKSFCFDVLLVAGVFCANGLLNGSGHTRFTFVNNVVPTFFIRVPAAWFISTLPGATLYAVGWAAPAASVLSVIITAIYLKTGRWKLPRI